MASHIIPGALRMIAALGIGKGQAAAGGAWGSITGTLSAQTDLQAALDAKSNMLSSGWIPAGETWTYASATTFTISGDQTAKYGKGDKLWLTQTSSKYFYIVAVSYSNPNTTITVCAGDVYSLANAAITSPFYSKAQSPVGFPDWFTWTPTLTGFSANPTTTIALFRLDGTTCTIQIHQIGAGTSNATTFTISLPITAATRATLIWANLVRTYNNGAYNTSPGFLTIGSAATAAAVQNNLSSTAWTNTGGKFLEYGTVSYQI